MSSTRKFNFDLCGYGETRKSWLKMNQNNKITIEQFIIAMKSFGGSWNPAKCSRTYTTLKRVYGFFQ